MSNMVVTGRLFLRTSYALRRSNRTQWRRLWSTPAWHSSSDVYKHFGHLRIEDLTTAQQVINQFRPTEQKLLMQILVKQDMEPDSAEVEVEPSRSQVKQLFLINTIPFIGFGVLDNAIMILAGESIDNYLGSMFCISTMAAAALGNIISDVAGVGLAHHVEHLVGYIGIKHPVLTSTQLESKRARLTVNLGRAFGLTVGCLIGMFPLLFFDVINVDSDSDKSQIEDVPATDKT